MFGFLILEASQPDGTSYRLAMGWSIPPRLVLMVLYLSRLI